METKSSQRGWVQFVMNEVHKEDSNVNMIKK